MQDCISLQGGNSTLIATDNKVAVRDPWTLLIETRVTWMAQKFGLCLR
jgi:hypothetical protein